MDAISRSIDKIKNLRVMKARGIRSPHKYILLFTIADLFDSNPKRVNEFPYTEELESAFTSNWLKFLPEADPKQIFLEYPYYHLKSDGIWTFRLKNGAEQLFQFYEESKSPDYRFTAKRIKETIEYASLSDDFLECMRSPISREKLQSTLREMIQQVDNPYVRSSDNTAGNENYPLLQHEQDAISKIQMEVEFHSLGCTISNFAVHDRNSNGYYECDMVIVSSSGMYVVELKHWSGHIQIAPYNWIQNQSFYKPDPHRSNDFKAKLLRSAYERKFPSYPHVFIESVVVLTNPDAIVDGASNPRTDNRNPTFDSIEHLIDYLRHQRKQKGTILDRPKIDNIASFYEGLKVERRPRDFQFPGYEVVEHLALHSDRVELVARSTNMRERHLIRLRLYYPPPDLSDSERQSFMRRASNTLDAVERIGDHPNILKVWPVPNQDGVIAEGSKWSETGTLRDLLEREHYKLTKERSFKLISGVLRGLQVMHDSIVIHRMLCPENILISEDTPKLMNFDLAYQLEDNHVTVIPDVTKLKLNAYTAPEVFRGQDISEATDLFSVGVILFELLTGERPFHASTDLDKMGGRLMDDKLRVLERSEVPEAIIDVIEKLVRLSLEERYQSVEDVMIALGVEPIIQAIRDGKLNRELAIGEEWNVYRIEKLMHKGVESQIYLARGSGDEQIVLKVFNEEVSQARVIAEANAASTVYSPYLAQAKAGPLLWNRERYFIHFGYVRGETLRKAILSGRRPGNNEFVEVAQTLLQAVVMLHTQGENAPLLHNDIKPDNVLVSPDGYAVLIDFGSASSPGISTYQGTEGYVAPDLRLGTDLKYCVSGDVFALGVTLFEWYFGFRPYTTPVCGATPRDVSGVRDDMIPGIDNWLYRAIITSPEERFVSVSYMLDEFRSVVHNWSVVIEDNRRPVAQSKELGKEKSDTTGLERVELIELDVIGNPFVAYLNSLQSVTADSENSLAESQAVNRFFGYIHVPLKITDYICEQLMNPSRRNVILTGHAGDGKSTIGLELYKRLKAKSLSDPLEQPMAPREEIQTDNGCKVVLIKDMSELSAQERLQLLEEAISASDDHFFIISNTGTLLETFRDYFGELFDENDFLERMDSFKPKEMVFSGAVFDVINLARVDNIEVAGKLLERMVDPDRWELCQTSECKEKCPIYRNVRLMQGNLKTVSERISLVYRRMYEYGERLTLRQISSHLAYIITSGLTYERIVELSLMPSPPPIASFLFFNRFFGDDGTSPDENANQLRAIRSISRQEFGLRPCPSVERKLWIQSEVNPFTAYIHGAEDEFEELRRLGARMDDGAGNARRQVRRMLYFLEPFERDQDGVYIRTFLNSPMILALAEWRKPDGELSSIEKRALKRRVIHVIQEHFSGIRLPESREIEPEVFITLNRRSRDIRQSAQIVLAKYQSEDFLIDLDVVDTEIGRDYSVLVLKESRSKEQLKLDLPFLDYVMMRQQGEVGQILQASYVDRLENFKSRLLEAGQCRRSGNMMLVRLRTNRTFKKQTFTVRGSILEVTDD